MKRELLIWKGTMITTFILFGIWKGFTHAFGDVFGHLSISQPIYWVKVAAISLIFIGGNRAIHEVVVDLLETFEISKEERKTIFELQSKLEEKNREIEEMRLERNRREYEGVDE